MRQAAITKAVIYTRCSTDEQGNSGLGLEAQEAKCRELAARNGWDVLAVYSDPDISGRKPVEKRPGLKAAIEAVQSDPDRILICYELTRLARNVLMALEVLEPSRGNVPFVSASHPDMNTSTPYGRAAVAIFATFAQLEAEGGAERTKAALKAAKARGRHVGGLSLIESWRPTGQLNARGRMVHEAVVDPKKVETIRTVQNMARNAPSMEALTRSLNEVGIPSVTGKKWHPRIVKIAVGMELPPA